MKSDKFLLEVVDLEKYFHILRGVFRGHVGDVKAVDGVNFGVREGEVVGIVGESGCGKSTVGRTAIRLLDPTGGRIFYRGEEITNLSMRQMRKYRSKLQIVFQDPFASLNPRKTIYEAFREVLTYHNPSIKRSLCLERILGVMERVGLSEDALKLYPHEFSGGQQQRICIGRSLLVDPELIVLDEAVSALDVSIQAQILNLLSDLKKTLGLSYFFISHDLSVVKHISDRIVVMYMGKVVESASVEDIFLNPCHPYTKLLLSAVPKEHPDEKKERQEMRGEVSSLVDYPQGCPFHPRCPYAKDECRESFPEKKVLDGGHEYYCILPVLSALKTDSRNIEE